MDEEMLENLQNQKSCHDQREPIFLSGAFWIFRLVSASKFEVCQTSKSPHNLDPIEWFSSTHNKYCWSHQLSNFVVRKWEVCNSSCWDWEFGLTRFGQSVLDIIVLCGFGTSFNVQNWWQKKWRSFISLQSWKIEDLHHIHCSCGFIDNPTINKKQMSISGLWYS